MFHYQDVSVIFPTALLISKTGTIRRETSFGFEY